MERKKFIQKSINDVDLAALIETKEQVIPFLETVINSDIKTRNP